MEQLREIGLTSEMNVMERPVYYRKLLEGKPKEGYGHKGFPGRQIVMSISMIAGDASLYVDNWLRCGGSYSFLCDKRIDKLWRRYLKGLDLQERADVVTQAQNIVLDEYIYVQLPMTALPGPPEDFKLRAGR